MSDMQEGVNGEVADNLKAGEYRIPIMKCGEVVGQIRCSRPGLRLIDFYRTTSVLAKDVNLVLSGAGGVVGEIPHDTPQNMKGGQS